MNKIMGRVYALDILRGIAVIGMVFHHSLVSAEIVFDTTFDILSTKAFEIVQLLFVMIFLLVSGICTNYSRNIIKRGLIVTGAALVVSFATCVVMPYMGITGLNIYFGILHMFGLSMLIFGLLEKAFKKINPVFGMILFTVLFFVYYAYYKTEPIGSSYILMAFGVLHEDITSYGDYYPLLPYFFMFITGTYLGIFVKRRSFPDWFYNLRCAFFEKCGKYSLWVYIVHQPIIFGAFYLISMIKG